MRLTSMREGAGIEIADIQKYIECVTPREKKVLEMRYGLGEWDKTHKLREIGQHFDRSSNRIRQIEWKGLRKIKRQKERDSMNELVKTTNMQWNLLSDDCIPPIGKPVIVKDSRGSVSLTKLKYIWEHQSQPAYFGPPTEHSYWMLLPDIEVPAVKHELLNKLLTPIKELDLTKRTLNCLEAESIRFVGDIVCKEGAECRLLKSPNLGRKSLKEITEVLQKHGVNMYEECPAYEQQRAMQVGRQ